MTPRRTRLTLTAALLLPLAALAASWAVTHRQAQQGQDWLIPIQGYDPRDLLRGHYVQYRYDWPTSPQQQTESAVTPGEADALCITGSAPHIRAVWPLSGSPDPAVEKHCAIILRGTLGTRREIRGLDTGIFYASQSEALVLSRKLADPDVQGLIRVRVRPDGMLRPIAMEFRRRPRLTP
ncbi:GDYXXLXY domain-containing protein [Sphingobium sp. WCS2017Hpa-17]|uniref:GDYXXLXY domain-containing protein n=1 Tax=Sphingobium sp. WCS2017Hpa-17 TaxID=3073638 RepID=UPI00288A391A|nr:GDYXXLXY domain-containing protein [Sphingobium sp. WCS2017Hpa-17]